MEYKVVGGVCRPETFEALDLFKSLQRETNRVLDSLDKKLLYVDGRIGDKTRLAVNAVLGTSFKTCSEISDRVKSLHNSVYGLAQGSQLPVVADPESIRRSIVSPPSTFDRDTNTVINPSIMTAGFGGVPLWVIALGLGGGYYYYYQTPSGKKARKALGF
jgi:hypothetical protein